MPKQCTKIRMQVKTLILSLIIAQSQLAWQPIRQRERIVVQSSGKIKSIYPAQANTFHSLQLISALGDTLYKIDSNGALQPRLAAKLPVLTDNGLTLSIPLRENVFFHDGTRFDAKAMAFSIKRFMKIGNCYHFVK